MISGLLKAATTDIGPARFPVLLDAFSDLII